MSTISKVKVNRVIKGHVPSSALSVRQLGTSGHPAFPADELALLERGKSYILFLQPFTFSDRLDTGQFTVAGEVGSFVVDGARARRPGVPVSVPTGVCEQPTAPRTPINPRTTP